MKIVAIDYGEKRVGLAASGPGGLAVGLPLFEMRGGGGDVRRLAEVVKEQEPDRVVVGLPLNMDGSEGPAAERVRAFAGELGLHLEVPIEFVDERLTSEEAEGRLRGVPLSPAKKRIHINTVAAQVILETCLKGGRP